MIAADTNLLVRHIVEDDARQAAEARQAFSTGPVYVSNVVLAELAWVLESCYEYPKSDILDALREVSKTVDVTFASRSVVTKAIAAFAQHGADLADWLILYEAVEHGCTQVLSFDKACLRTGLFHHPGTS